MTRGAGVIGETPWWLEVNGRRVATGTVRPPRIREMAAGRLRADGFITGAADLIDLDIAPDADGCTGIRARLSEARAAAGLAEREHRLARGCGPLHIVTCDPAALRHRRTAELPDAADFPALFRQLFAAADEASAIGGVHAAALVDRGSLIERSVDVSRHNAVDKAIGGALLAGRDPGALGLVVTARISGEMAQKAARCGVAWVASRSLPTTLAVAIAEAAGMPLVARAAGADATVYAAAPERAS